MRIKIDENLPIDLTAALTALGHDVDHVKTSGLARAKDPDVWLVARNERRLLITQDVEFTDARVIETKSHPGFVLVRTTQDEGFIITRISEVFRAHDVESWRDCIVVISDDKVRVRRKPTE